MTPVLFHFVTPNGEPVANTQFEIQLSKSAFDEQETGVVLPRLVTAVTDAAGEATVNLWPSDKLYYVSLLDEESEAGLSYKFYVPAVDAPATVRLQDIVVDAAMSATSYDEAALLTIQNTKAVTAAHRDEAGASATQAAGSAVAAEASRQGAVTAKSLAENARDAAVTASTFTPAGTGAVVRTAQDKLRGISKSVEDYFLAGMTDYTLAVQRCVNAVGAGGIVDFETDGPYVISGTGVAVQISAKNVTFRGRGNTQIQFSGTGSAIQLDADDGGQWDAGSYNGSGQGFRLQGIHLRCMNDGSAGKPRTALLNSITGGFYGTGAYGIRDWRGGSVRLDRCKIEAFEYGLWGIQSDINYGTDVTLANNHVAVFLGARSDQSRWDKVWSFGNDTVWIFEGSRSHVVTQWITDTDGSGTTAPCIVRNAEPTRNAKYSSVRTHSGVVFESPWLEQLGSFGSANPGYDVQYVFDIGMGDTTEGGGVVIRYPYANTQMWSDATKVHFFYLVRAATLQAVTVEELAGPRTFKAIFYVDASALNTPRMFFSDADNTGGNIVESYHATSAYVHVRSRGITQQYSANQRGGTGAVNIGNIGLHRALIGNNTPQISGTNGDIVLNRNYTFGKSLGWVWNGSSVSAIHAPTVGGNRGAISTTLNPETDHEEQLWATVFTADLEVVLAAPPASGIAVTGLRFRIARPATGAFNLNVKNLTSAGTLLKAMPANSWAEFVYDGTNWRIAAAGSL